jgi:tRNA G18 (ribose-2'-O)-methylase SpoU
MKRIRQLRGVAEISEALAASEPLGLLLVQEDVSDRGIAELVSAAREKGVPVRIASASVLRRMTSVGPLSSVLALAGRVPEAGFDEVLEQRGAIWLLLNVAFATNAGVAIRTAEGSGADAIVVDAPHFDHADRRSATRASMRADWYMPVFWWDAERAIERARAFGHRIIAVENSGDREPWDLDLTEASLFIVGGESEGIPEHLLAATDHVVRVPMGGFIPSFNLQIAVGVVGVERLRQLARDVGVSAR